MSLRRGSGAVPTYLGHSENRRNRVIPRGPSCSAGPEGRGRQCGRERTAITRLSAWLGPPCPLPYGAPPAEDPAGAARPAPAPTRPGPGRLPRSGPAPAALRTRGGHLGRTSRWPRRHRSPAEGSFQRTPRHQCLPPVSPCPRAPRTHSRVPAGGSWALGRPAGLVTAQPLQAVSAESAQGASRALRLPSSFIQWRPYA